MVSGMMKKPHKTKSLVEQASSVSKAIEQGWNRAGNPSEFSIKVLEVAEKNFIGMTVKPAKIGIFFQEQPATEPATPKTQQKPKEPAPQKKERPLKTKAPQHSAHPVKNEPATPRTQPTRKKERIVWNPEMIEETKQLLSTFLKFIPQANQPFDVHADNYYLKVSFLKPLHADKEQDRILFRSLAHLLMQAVRNKFKKGFHGLKIILSTPES